MYIEIQTTNNKCRFCGGGLGYFEEKRNTRTFRRKYFSDLPIILDSKEFFRTCCIDCFYKKFKRYPKSPNAINNDFYFLLEIPLDVIDKEKKRRFSITKEKMIKRYGNKDGTERWNNYCEKQAYSNSFEYKNKKYGWSEEEFNLYNKSRAITLKNLIKKYGDKDGIKRYNEYCEKQSKNGNTLEYFQEVYGLSEGKERYEKVCKMKSITPENMKRLYGDKWKEKYFKWLFSERTVKYYSQVSQKVFNKIVDVFNLNKETVFYHDNNSEKCFIDNDIIYFYDFIDKENKICIEFNGEHCHPNKKMDKDQWNKWKCVYTGKTADLKFDEDCKKMKFIKKMGFKYHVIWYEEWILNPENVMMGVKFIYEKRRK